MSIFNKLKLNIFLAIFFALIWVGIPSKAKSAEAISNGPYWGNIEPPENNTCDEGCTSPEFLSEIHLAMDEHSILYWYAGDPYFESLMTLFASPQLSFEDTSDLINGTGILGENGWLSESTCTNSNRINVIPDFENNGFEMETLGYNAIYFVNNFSAENCPIGIPPENCFDDSENVIALTYVDTQDPSPPYSAESRVTIQINTEMTEPVPNLIKTSGTPGDPGGSNVWAYSFQFIIAHELGHAVGLPHPDGVNGVDPDGIMDPSQFQAGRWIDTPFDFWPNLNDRELFWENIGCN